MEKQPFNYTAAAKAGEQAEKRLRDAAPDLLASQTMSLEVLEAQRNWMGKRPENPTLPYDISVALLIDALDIAISNARAAIAKAKGEA